MRILFVPVSAARGFGEYARARELARAIHGRWPDAQLHFALSVQAPYAAQCPFPATLLPGSATLHTPQVVALLGSFKPDIVIFDNAGRTTQIRAAVALGARVVYISSRRRQRAKAFRFRWMRLLSEHWIAYPRFTAGDLSLLESLKLKLLRRPHVRFLDTLLPVDNTEPDPLPQLRDFVLVVPGGGTAHPGARTAPAVSSAAAAALAATGVPTVLVGALDELGTSASMTRLSLLPQPQLVALLRRARVVVTNGGDTLLQALACGCACVAVPIAHDQAARIARCCDLGLIHAAPLVASAIVAAAAKLYGDEPERSRLIARTRTVGITDAMPQVLDSIAALASAAPS
jgi:spore coat polysaccharide biosynthesis predicted glycosyltransferase SpsG